MQHVVISSQSVGLNDPLSPKLSAASRHSGAGAMGQAADHEDPYNPVQHEQALWRAVIVQALMDASTGSAKMEAQVAKREARTWLRGNSEDFYTVCFYANMDPDFVRETAAKVLERNCIWRAAPGTGPMKKDPRRALAKNPRKFTQRR